MTEKKEIPLTELRRVLHEGIIARYYDSESHALLAEVKIETMYTIFEFKEKNTKTRSTHRRIKTLAKAMRKYAPLKDWRYIVSFETETNNQN